MKTIEELNAKSICPQCGKQMTVNFAHNPFRALVSCVKCNTFVDEQGVIKTSVGDNTQWSCAKCGWIAGDLDLTIGQALDAHYKHNHKQGFYCPDSPKATQPEVKR